MLNEVNEIEKVWENRNISNFIFVDGTWIYALKDPAIGYDNKLDRSEGNILKAGFYIYDVARMFEGQIEVHLLSNALSGALSFIDFDFDTQTVAFIRDFNSIVMMPLVHRNTILF